MADVLIRNVPVEDLARIDEQAAQLGLSRGDYLRRRIHGDAFRSLVVVTADDLQQFGAATEDLLDPELMADAWS